MESTRLPTRSESNEIDERVSLSGEDELILPEPPTIVDAAWPTIA